MANSVAAETPCENDGILWCTVDLTSVNTGTGDIEKRFSSAGRRRQIEVPEKFCMMHEMLEMAEIGCKQELLENVRRGGQWLTASRRPSMLHEAGIAPYMPRLLSR